MFICGHIELYLHCIATAEQDIVQSLQLNTDIMDEERRHRPDNQSLLTACGH